ncbi:MAG: helix-turn-helix transcriptional regulator [Oscillospiraceae bacterium]|nr:helix-turn-helix transcriptional regulator [Oscillospiraceae bacterium]
MSDEEKKLARVIGRNIERLLNNRALNQNELANILGVSESTVGKWVLGKSIPRMGTVQRIADFFSVSKSAILDNPNQSFQFSESHSQYTSSDSITLQSLKDEHRILLSSYDMLGGDEKEFFRKQIERAARERGETDDNG